MIHHPDGSGWACTLCGEAQINSPAGKTFDVDGAIVYITSTLCVPCMKRAVLFGTTQEEYIEVPPDVITPEDLKMQVVLEDVVDANGISRRRARFRAMKAANPAIPSRLVNPALNKPLSEGQIMDASAAIRNFGKAVDFDFTGTSLMWEADDDDGA